VKHNSAESVADLQKLRNNEPYTATLARNSACGLDGSVCPERVFFEFGSKYQWNSENRLFLRAMVASSVAIMNSGRIRIDGNSGISG